MRISDYCIIKYSTWTYLVSLSSMPPYQNYPNPAQSQNENQRVNDENHRQTKIIFTLWAIQRIETSGPDADTWGLLFLSSGKRLSNHFLIFWKILSGNIWITKARECSWIYFFKEIHFAYKIDKGYLVVSPSSPLGICGILNYTDKGKLKRKHKYVFVSVYGHQIKHNEKSIL